jgi:hypothetical protein
MDEMRELLRSISWVEQRPDDRHRIIGISGTKRAVSIVQVDPDAAVFKRGEKWVVCIHGRTLSQLPQDAAQTMPCFGTLGEAKLHAMLELATSDAAGRMDPPPKVPPPSELTEDDWA